MRPLSCVKTKNSTVELVSVPGQTKNFRGLQAFGLEASGTAGPWYRVIAISGVQTPDLAYIVLGLILELLIITSKEVFYLLGHVPITGHTFTQSV